MGIKTFEPGIHYHSFPLKYDEKIILKAGDYRIYKNVTVITPGEWTDMVTNAPVLWAEDKLKKFGTNWQYNYVNLSHGHYTLDFIGTIQNGRWDDGAIRGDIYINPKLSRGKDTIIGIDSGLLNNVSVEAASEDYWDSERMIRCADKIVLMGLSILGPWPGPACSDSKIK